MKRLPSLVSGFSLVEVNMAIFILAGGVLGLLGLFPMGLRESQEARNEMRVATFAERFLGAAQAAAQHPDVTDVDSLASKLESLGFDCETGTSGQLSSTSNLSVEKDDSGVWYQAWVLEDTTWNNTSLADDLYVAEVGVRVTAENAEQSTYYLKTAPIYSIRVLLDARRAQ